MTELVHAGIPILQAVPHAIDLLHIQHLRLHPVDLRHAGHLVDRSAQQTERQRLHDQVFDLIGLNLGLGGDGREGQGPVVRRTAEHHLCEGGQGDLLVQEIPVRLQQLVLADVAGEHVVGGQVATVKGEEQLAQPVMRGLGQGVQDRVQQELAEVVDRVGDEGGNAEVVGAGDTFALRELFEVDAGQVEEGIFVEGGEFLLGLCMMSVSAML